MIDVMNITGKFAAVYKTMMSNNDYETAAKYLEEKLKIRSLVGMYLHKDEYTDEDKQMISHIISILQAIYNNSDVLPPVPDDEYDQLYEVFREITERELVGAPIGSVKDRPIGYHKYPDLRGTLDKIHFVLNSDKKPKERRKSLEDWLKSVENRLGRKLRPDELIAEFYPKWDGLSAIFECNKDMIAETVLTRGDTDKNEAVDLSKLFSGTDMSYIDSPFRGVDVGVKTEIVMSRDNYNRLCKIFGEFKSPRSAVSSILNSKELDKIYLEFLTIIPLQVQNFETKEIDIPDFTQTDFPSEVVANILNPESVKEAIKYLKDRVDKEYGIDIDGIVMRLVNPTLQKLLGRRVEDNINNYEVAYKFPAEVKKTILKDVDWSTGILGAVTPVAKVEPVKLKGNTIKSISLGSEDIFLGHDLNMGDEVIIKYDVIPYFEKDETCVKGTGPKFEVPTHCKYCGVELVREPELRCQNNDCDSRKIGKIVNYTEKMRIPNVSIGIVTDLFNHGYLHSIEDLYLLKDHKKSITVLDGYGEKSFKNIIEGINSRREVYDYEMMGSIGIPTIGERMFKKILNIYYLDDLIEICEKDQENKLTTIGGVQTKTAEKIISGVNYNKETIKFLRSVLKIKRDDRKHTIKVLFTKVRDKDFEKFLDKKGVLVLENYNSEVDMVIVPTLTTSSGKVDDARKHGKEIITIDDAYKMFEYKH